MTKPFTLLSTAALSTDTIKCLRALLVQAEKGEVIGIAYAAMMKRRVYVVNACGEAHRSLTFTRGMVKTLDDELGQRVRSKSA